MLAFIRNIHLTIKKRYFLWDFCDFPVIFFGGSILYKIFLVPLQDAGSAVIQSSSKFKITKPRNNYKWNLSSKNLRFFSLNITFFQGKIDKRGNFERLSKLLLN